MTARDYPAFYRSLVAGQVVRPRGPAHPRLFIWGPLEARLQQPDVVILGSLNEGVWPRPQEAGPWLSRPMREKLGLTPPERRIGLSAHDFAQALGAPSVYLTRALKVDGVPTVPSRWLQRLEALVAASGLSDKIKPDQPWVAWARLRDQAPAFAPAAPPQPRPPSDARPRELSVTRIERWIANPYEIFARHILKLEPLKPLGAEPDAAMRGSIVHEVLHEFSRAHPQMRCPTTSMAALIAHRRRSVRQAWQRGASGSLLAAALPALRPLVRRHRAWRGVPAIAATNTEVDGALDSRFRLPLNGSRRPYRRGGRRERHPLRLQDRQAADAEACG